MRGNIPANGPCTAYRMVVHTVYVREYKRVCVNYHTRGNIPANGPCTAYRMVIHTVYRSGNITCLC